MVSMQLVKPTCSSDNATYISAVLYGIDCSQQFVVVDSVTSLV